LYISVARYATNMGRHARADAWRPRIAIARCAVGRMIHPEQLIPPPLPPAGLHRQLVMLRYVYCNTIRLSV
jgi:hypothetical protein